MPWWWFPWNEESWRAECEWCPICGMLAYLSRHTCSQINLHFHGTSYTCSQFQWACSHWDLQTRAQTFCIYIKDEVEERWKKLTKKIFSMPLYSQHFFFVCRRRTENDFKQSFLLSIQNCQKCMIWNNRVGRGNDALLLFFHIVNAIPVIQHIFDMFAFTWVHLKHSL